MNIVQKLKVDEELTGNIQIVLRNETGVYTPTNTTGYGGPNGSPTSKIEKYIFELNNLHANLKYRQIHSDDLDAPNEYNNPSLPRILNKENVVIDSNNFNITKFEDGLYKIYMYAQIDTLYQGNGYINNEVIISVPGAVSILQNYQAVIIGDQIYNIQGITGGNIVLDRPIVANFTLFKVLLKTSITYILSDDLNDCINSNIAKMAADCGCDKDLKSVNVLSEIQIYHWGMQRYINKNDYGQAYSFFKLAKELCSSLNCNCHGG